MNNSTTLFNTSYSGPDAYALAHWRMLINDLYSQIRSIEDPERAWKLWHKVRTDMFYNHVMSPVSEDRLDHFQEIEVFPYDPSYRFAVRLVEIAHQREGINLGNDGEITLLRVARTSGLEEVLGNELDVFWIEGYGGGIFIPFKDGSSGKETYGGGRYLVDAIKGSDLGLDDANNLILDFNFAYNPSCSMSDKYVCPLAPAQNTFASKILAGEKIPTWAENSL